MERLGWCHLRLTFDELDDIVSRAEKRGFEAGFEASENLARLPVNDCPMCQMKVELERAQEARRIAEYSRPRRGPR